MKRNKKPKDVLSYHLYCMTARVKRDSKIYCYLFIVQKVTLSVSSLEKKVEIEFSESYMLSRGWKL